MVNLLDYGSDHRVLFSDLRKDVANVTSFPKVSYQLTLWGVTYLGPRGEATLNLHRKLCEQTVEVTVHEIHPKLDPGTINITNHFLDLSYSRVPIRTHGSKK